MYKIAALKYHDHALVPPSKVHITTPSKNLAQAMTTYWDASVTHRMRSYVNRQR